MSKYKLTYFDCRRRAEVIRYIFALAGQEYEDERFPRYKDGEEQMKNWQENVKPGTLWGTLPEITVDGRQMCQTPAIARYLASKFDLMGNSPEDHAYIDMLMCCADDLLALVKQYKANTSLKEKQSDVIKENQDKISYWLKRMTTFLTSNNDGKGWFVGVSVTVADLYIANVLTFSQPICPDILNNFQELQGLVSRVEALPEIAAWIKNRPITKT